MIEVSIPGHHDYKFTRLILDLNGTISLDGKIIEGVSERLALLSKSIDIILVTADTQGKAIELGKCLQIKTVKINSGDEQYQKRAILQQSGSQAVVAIGNGSNDAAMLKEAGLGICVIGPEGASCEAIVNCKVAVTDINAALDLLIKPQRLIATLRK